MATRKLFKVSKEFNLGKDTLTNFLQKLVEDGKANVTFKGPNTIISDQVYTMISDKFQREKEQAERIIKQRQQRHDEHEISLEAPEAKPVEKPAPVEEPKVEAPKPEPVKAPVVESKPEAPAAVAKSEKDVADEKSAPTHRKPDENRDRNQSGNRPAYNRDRNQGGGDRPAYNRDRNQSGGDRPAYNRDRNQSGGDRPAYNRDRNQGGGDRPAYNRDRNQGGGDRPAYNRDRNQGGGDRPAYNRDRNQSGGDRPAYNRDRNQGGGDRPSYNRDRNQGGGDRPSYNRDRNQGDRPGAAKPEPFIASDKVEKERPSKLIQPKKATTPARPGNTEAEKQKKKRQAMQMLKKKGKDTGLSSLDKIISTEEGANYRKKKKSKKAKPDSASVSANIKQTLHEQTKKRRKKVKKKQEDGTVVEVNVLKINEFMATQDLANLMDVPVTEIITKCLMDLKLMVNINQRLDLDTIRLLAEEYGFEIEEEEEFGSEFLEEGIAEDEGEHEIITRAPIITVMGHVDHGKTSLLDYVRSENVVAGESGGITQHIGAYEVETKSGAHITFLDTPGHEAFSAMRARGAQATDVVILIVAADDGVMPQTKEAIDHAKAAGVPFVVAITKTDKPSANTDRVVQMLSEYDVLVEDWGGQIQCQRVSSKTGEGIDELLEKVLIEAEVLELDASPTKKAKGVVVETKIEKGKGTVATILIQDGTLRVGDHMIVGPYAGRVKAMYNERGNNVEIAGPSTPVQIIGIDGGVPQAGDRLIQMESAAQTKDVARKRQQLKREQDFRQMRKITLDDISHDISLGGVQELNLLVKGDVDGSVEALSDSLIKLSHDEVRVNVVRKAVGPITESDIILASASSAIIIGFHVRPVPSAAALAEKENVEIRNYRIVYDAINEIRDALEGMLRPEIRETVIGEAEIKELYKITKIGNVAGTLVTKGRIKRDSHVRVIREGVEVFEGKLSSLKRFQDDVKDVVEGFDCGIQIANFNDIKKGDVLEFFEQTEIARKLDDKK